MQDTLTPTEADTVRKMPRGLFAEQCISIRTIDGVTEARSIEIMRETNTMFGDDFGIRYSKGTLIETGVAGEEAWTLHHRHSEHALAVLAEATANNKKS